MAQRIGLLGGSFNPIHIGHLMVAEGAREALGLERVVFIPAKAPPHKLLHELAPVEDRLRMVELAIAGNPHFELSDVEIRRDGPSYSVDTVRGFREQLRADAEIDFIIGADSVPELRGWYKVAELASLCRIVPVSRPGVVWPECGTAAPGSDSSLEQILGREALAAIRSRLVQIPLVALSASEVRERVRAGRSIRYLVPDAVAEHIRRHGLYILPPGAPPRSNSGS